MTFAVEISFQVADERCRFTDKAYEEFFSMTIPIDLFSKMEESFDERPIGSVLPARVCSAPVNDSGVNIGHNRYELILQDRKTKSRRERPRLSEEEQRRTTVDVTREDRWEMVAVQIIRHDLKRLHLHVW